MGSTNLNLFLLKIRFSSIDPKFLNLGDRIGRINAVFSCVLNWEERKVIISNLIFLHYNLSKYFQTNLSNFKEARGPNIK